MALRVQLLLASELNDGRGLYDALRASHNFGELHAVRGWVRNVLAERLRHIS
jgi:hypothetical protein